MIWFGIGGCVGEISHNPFVLSFREMLMEKKTKKHTNLPECCCPLSLSATAFLHSQGQSYVFSCFLKNRFFVLNRVPHYNEINQSKVFVPSINSLLGWKRMFCWQISTSNLLPSFFFSFTLILRL